MRTKVILSREDKVVIALLQDRLAMVEATMQARRDEIHTIFNNFVARKRKEGEVPPDWKFDLDEMAFIPPIETVCEWGEVVEEDGG